MALDLAERLRVFYASAPQRIREITTVSIEHPLLSQTWHLWPEPYAGTVTLETGATAAMRPCAMAVEPAGSPSHLDQVYRIGLDTTDPEDTFRTELDRIPLDDETPVQLTYRKYLSDDLTDVQAREIVYVETTAWERGKALLTAAAPRFNLLRTGRVYAPRDIPMLRAFV